ncbi:MAG: hypothetical protein NTX73_13765 [Rhodobacterales bacterium]|nr:hypothetical protein [Rhodobacterales bacterium]
MTDIRYQHLDAALVDGEFWAQRTVLVALVDSEMSRTDWLSLPRMLRWRFLLNQDNANLLAREFMRMLCLLRLSPGSVIVPWLLLRLVGWFASNPSYQVHLADFAGHMPALRPVQVSEASVQWCYTLTLYKEVFGSLPPPAIWTLQHPDFSPWVRGRIVGMSMVVLWLLSIGICIGMPMVLVAFLDRQLTIALVHLFNFETPASWAEARINLMVYLIGFPSAVITGVFIWGKAWSLPLGHPWRHALNGLE